MLYILYLDVRVELYGRANNIVCIRVFGTGDSKQASQYHIRNNILAALTGLMLDQGILAFHINQYGRVYLLYPKDNENHNFFRRGFHNHLMPSPPRSLGRNVGQATPNELYSIFFIIIGITKAIDFTFLKIIFKPRHSFKENQDEF
ncbi:hypothetical protein ACJX0J_035308 [Zea mays]